MEETAVPLHSWFWLIVPMMAVFALSVINYLRNRETPSESVDTDRTSGFQGSENALESNIKSNTGTSPGKNDASNQISTPGRSNPPLQGGRS